MGYERLTPLLPEGKWYAGGGGGIKSFFLIPLPPRKKIVVRDSGNQGQMSKWIVSAIISHM